MNHSAQHPKTPQPLHTRHVPRGKKPGTVNLVSACAVFPLRVRLAGGLRRRRWVGTASAGRGDP